MTNTTSKLPGRGSRVLRVEELDELLDHGVENPQSVLETLVNAAAKGNHLPALFDKLHAVAVEHDKVADLAFAYEHLAQDRRIKLLTPNLQAEVFLHAVSFFADVFGDPDGAATYAERVLAVVPGHPEAVTRLEKLLSDAGDRSRLAKFYLDLASHEKDRAQELVRLNQVVTCAADVAQLNDLAIDALTRIIKLEPADAGAREDLEGRLLRAGKPREAVKVLEQALSREPPPSDAESFQIRTRLLDLYTRELGEPHRAVPHIETLLMAAPEHLEARQAAEALLDNRSVAARVAAALSDAYDKLGLREQATAMLNFELKVVRGPRRLEVQRRLAFIKQDGGDPTGALELLGPVVSADPAEDEARRRFVELSLSLNQPAEAAKLLTRALGQCKDPAIRARVGAEIGVVYLRSGDVKRADATFRQVIEDKADPAAVLVAATHLAELHEKAGDVKDLAAMLEIVVRHEPDAEKRNMLARRLARLAEGELNEPVKAITAWRALVDSPWADEALRRLSALYEAAGDWDGLSEITERQAIRAKDQTEARRLMFHAAELRSAKGRDKAGALTGWRAYLARFGPSREVHAQMIPLLEQEKQWKELAWVIERDIELAPAAEWVPLLNKLAQLRQSRLDDMPGALAAYRKAMQTDSTDKVSRIAVEKLLTSGSARLEAADILESVYRAEEPGTGLLKVLETRADLSSESDVRLAALDEAVAIADKALRDPARALELAARGLELSIANEPSQIPKWIERVHAYGAESGQPAARANVLVKALGKRAIDSRELVALARAAAEALVESGESAKAIAIFRRALEFEPNAAELLARIDELLAERGTPEERLMLYRSALERGPEPARRREILHSMARLQQKENHDPNGAIETWKLALEDDTRDPAAHQALVELYTQVRDWNALYAELERVIGFYEGERRNATLLHMAEVSAEAGDVARALEHYRELLGATDPSDSVLETIELLAHANNDAETMRIVLERRIAVANAPEDRAALLEKLGFVQAKQLVDPAAAGRSWLAGARFADAAGDDERARRLYERVLGVAPDESEAARRLIELYASGGSWQKIPEAFSVLLRTGADERDVVALLLSLEGPAREASAAEVFVVLTDTVLERSLEPGRLKQVLLALARVLTPLPNRADEVAEIYRRVLISGSDDDLGAVADGFAGFLAASELTPQRIADRRWLFQWRSSHATDPITVLMAWAHAEETTLGNPTAAIALYQRVLEHDADRVDALQHLARLQSNYGNPEGALATLEGLRERTQGEQRAEIELSIASLVLERLGRPLDALKTIEELLDANPSSPEVLRLVRVALGYRETQSQAAMLLERVADSAETPAQKAEVLENLLAVTEGVDELAAARGRWYRQLLECKEDDDDAVLAIALRGAEERPAENELWDAAEKAGRRLNRPDPIAEAYARVLERQLPPELAEEIGRRLVEFNEEWFEDAERVVGLLQRVLDLCPTAEWAFDRLKLAFNAAARWPDLFQLYDRALDRAEEPARRIDLLREAAMAAKDFANDAERAIDYLERLDRASPGDARIEAALERLYEREGRTRPLIDLLSRRFESATGTQREDLSLRVAGLWLDQGEPIDAYKILKDLLLQGERSEIYSLLERLLAVPAARTSVAPDSDADPREQRESRSVRHASAEILRRHYQEIGQKADVARMLEIELELSSTTEERVAGLQGIIELRLNEIGDVMGAFESTAQLVAFEPQKAEHRQRLAELAKRTDSEARRAEILVTIADGATDPSVRVSLLAEAAEVRRSELGDASGAIELFALVLYASRNDRDVALAAARELDDLLERTGRAAERCDVLDRLAELESDGDRRRHALGQVALVAANMLGDYERSIRAWRARLSEDARDTEALDGVVEVLERAGRWVELVEALEERIAGSDQAAARKRDRVMIARIWSDRMDDRERAIEAWEGVRKEFGKDRDSFVALADLLAASGRYSELALLVEGEAAEEADPDRQRSLRARLGELHSAHTGDLSSALEAFVLADAWERAQEVVSITTERAASRALAERLLERAVEHWTVLEEPESKLASGPGAAASWALSELVTRLGEEGNHVAVAELLLRGRKLPFPRHRKRVMLRDAACLATDRLADPKRAIELFRELFSEDPSDDIAQSSVTRFAALLDEQNFDSEIASLWETQADCRARISDLGTAAALYARAAEISEQRLSDLERAIKDHRAGAALGGEASLEALARIYDERGDAQQSAAVLEWLCAQSSRDELGERALRLAEAYVKAGAPTFARARLEHAVQIALEAGPVRQRLAELYRSEEAWQPLADLLTTEAGRAPDAKTRLRLLRETAKIHLDKRNDAGAAVPLLEQAIELAPDEPGLRLLLAEAFTKANRFDDALTVLKQQVERYGTRKPKDRALVHFHLAKVSLAAGRRAVAIAELDLANKIDPAHPGILQALAKLAFEEGQLDRAEKQYRALLLVLGRDDDEAPSRAEALLDLSEIAAHGGDSVRAIEFVESAFEAALESEREAEALERALKSRARHDLLARSIEARLERATAPAEAARALADLLFLHAEHLGGLGAAENRLRQRASAIHKQLEVSETSDDRAWAALGRVYDWLGDANAEAEVLERRVKALAQNRSQPDADPFYRLAEVRLADRALGDQGVEVLERALEIKPDIARAERLLRQALEVSPKSERVVALFERVARASDDPRILAEALLRTVDLKGIHSEALREGVALADKLGDHELAKRLLESALEKKNGLPPTERAWAMCQLADLLDSSESTSALNLREQAAALLSPEESRELLLAVAARATRDLGDHERAARIYELLHAPDPADRDVWEPLLEVYRKLGASTKLVELIEDTVPLVEDLADRCVLRLEEATILLDQGKPNEATDILLEITTEDPRQQKAADLLLKILDGSGRTDELVGLLVTQIEAAKDRQDVPAIVAHSVRLGGLLESKGRTDDAYDFYVGVLEWDKSNPEILNSVLRLAEMRDDPYVVGDALEALLHVERGERALELASRLVSLRSEQGDEAGAERALELGFLANPTEAQLREPLLERYSAKGDWAGAARILREAARNAPGDRELLARLVEAHRNAGDPAAALEALETLAADLGEGPEVALARAALLADQGRDEEAVQALEAAFAQNSECASDLVEALERSMARAEPPRDREILMRLVEVLETIGDFDGARARLAELVKLSPKDKEAIRRLAELEVRAERWDAASTIYRKLMALEDGAELLNIALLLSDACERAGRFADARGGLERALRVAPNDARIREKLRALYENTGDHRALAGLLLENAQAEQQVAARLDYLLRAGALLLMPDGDAARAVRVLEEARGLSPESVEGVVLLARAYAAGGRGDEGMALLGEIIAQHRGRRSREVSSAYREMSRIQLVEGFLSEALASLTRAFEMDMKNARLAMELGQLALDLDEAEVAGRAFRAVTMLRPSDDESQDGVTPELRAHAQYQLALMAQRSGDFRRAKVLASKALQENPEHELARQLLSELGDVTR